MDAMTVSLSPPRNRYRFDRLPPEEQSYLDRRMKERQELEVSGTLSTSAPSVVHFVCMPHRFIWIDGEMRQGFHCSTGAHNGASIADRLSYV